MKKIVIAFTLLVLSFTASGNTVGEYHSAASGNWSNKSSWVIWDGSSWQTPATYPGQTGPIDVSVSIVSSTTITADVSISFSSNGLLYLYTNATLQMGGYNITGPLPDLRISNGGSFITNGSSDITAVDIYGSLNNGGSMTTSTFVVELGASMTNSGTLTAITSLVNYDTFNASGAIVANDLYDFGTLTTSSSVDAVNFYVFSGGMFNTSYNGTSGWWQTSEPSVTALYGTAQFSSTTDGQVIPANDYYYTLSISDNGIKQMAGNIKVRSDFTIGSGATLDLNGNTLDVLGPGITFSNGTLKGGTGSKLNFDRGSSAPQDISGTGSFSGTFDEVNIGPVHQSCVNFFVDHGATGSGLLNTNSLTIDNGSNLGSYFNIGATSWVTAGTVTINRANGLLLQTASADSPTSASLLVTNSISGMAEVDYYLPAGGISAPYLWHYLASPIPDCPTTNFLTSPSNLAQYLENLVTTDQKMGWVATDGYKYFDQTMTGPTFTTLSLGRGYDYYNSTAKAVQTNGTINIGTVSNLSLSYNGAGYGTPDPATAGWNLLGNPFSCSLDWSAIENTLDPAIGKAIYFTNGSGGFSSWVNGVGTAGGSNLIPPMQGFFVHTTQSGKTITLPASAATHSGVARYKSATIIPLVRLAISGQGKSTDAVVRFDQNATPGYDNDFDAPVVSKEAGLFNIWTSSGNIDYSINGLPFPGGLGSTIEIPVGVYSYTQQNLTIKSSQITSLPGYSILLKDKLTNTSVDLKSGGAISFTAAYGSTKNRFTLTITNEPDAVPVTEASKSPFNIYYTGGILNIEPITGALLSMPCEIRIMDITGRTFLLEKKIEFESGTIRQIPFSGSQGVYIIEIRSGVNRYTGKIVIRK